MWVGNLRLGLRLAVRIEDTDNTLKHLLLCCTKIVILFHNLLFVFVCLLFIHWICEVTYCSVIQNGLHRSTEIRSDLHIMLSCSSSMTLSFKLSEPQAVDSTQTVVRSLTDGADDLGEMCCVKLNESVINIIVQSPSIAFRNFHHSWVPVLMHHSDLDLGSVIIFIQTVRDPQDVGGSAGFSWSQNIHYGRDEAFIIWNDGLKTGWISSDFHEVSSLGASFFDLKSDVRFVSLETSGFTSSNGC